MSSRTCGNWLLRFRFDSPDWGKKRLRDASFGAHSTPGVLEREFPFSTTEVFGNRIGFYNRENGQQAELGWIEIESMQPNLAISTKCAGQYLG